MRLGLSDRCGLTGCPQPESEEPAKADVEDEEEEAYLRNLENEFESFENIAPAASAPLQVRPWLHLRAMEGVLGRLVAQPARVQYVYR